MIFDTNVQNTSYLSINVTHSSNNCQYTGLVISLAITAEFPIEETGYLDEGFDFCVHEGQNLVSYPCENGLTIADTFPSEALAQFSGIVGEGQASTPINGTWVGSINAMTPTKGYWINSNSSFCFNYDCSED